MFSYLIYSLFKYTLRNSHHIWRHWIYLLSYPMWANNVATDFCKIFFAVLVFSLGGGDPCPSENVLKQNL